MRVSWIGVFLAPLPVPLLFSAGLLAVGLFSANPGSGLDGAMLLFAVALASSGFIAYGTTLFVFLPCLFVVSHVWPLNSVRVGLLGLLLGAAAFAPMTWIAWKSSGPGSGPPTESYPPSLADKAADPGFWLYGSIFPLAGLITAGLYWWLATRRHSQPMQTV